MHKLMKTASSYLLTLTSSMVLLLSACHPEESASMPGVLEVNFRADSLPAFFAPGLVSTGMFTRDMALSPDGKEMYFSISIGNYTHSTIVCSKRQDGHWTSPEIAPFTGGPGVMDLEPAFSHDGQQLFFMSTRAQGDEAPGNQDLWVVERRGEGWGPAKNLGAPVNTSGGEFFPSLTQDGTLYFTRATEGSRIEQIYRSRYSDGAYQEPELLPEQVNCGRTRFNAYISPDESFLIVPALGMPGSYDGVDYYITFRDASDRWSMPMNLGAPVNEGNTRGWSPYVSPDGNSFFFMSNKADSLSTGQWNYSYLKELHQRPGNGHPGMMFMDASFLRELRTQASFGD